MPIIRIKQASPFTIELVDDHNEVLACCTAKFSGNNKKWKVTHCEDTDGVTNKRFEMKRGNNGEYRVEISLT